MKKLIIAMLSFSLLMGSISIMSAGEAGRVG